ncbi:hypothetical protein BX600DRAFT_438301 [Xylariales sp. PMI_506]|nr:hypothetical protein BX600DRAFT_438301 [Xylariales sp. PMI_506]
MEARDIPGSWSPTSLPANRQRLKDSNAGSLSRELPIGVRFLAKLMFGVRPTPEKKKATGTTYVARLSDGGPEGEWERGCAAQGMGKRQGKRKSNEEVERLGRMVAKTSPASPAQSQVSSDRHSSPMAAICLSASEISVLGLCHVGIGEAIHMLVSFVWVARVDLPNPLGVGV